MDVGSQESAILKRWHLRHIEAYGELDSTRRWREENLDPHAPEARALLEGLRRTRDLAEFQNASDRWVRSFQSGYGGTGGQMILNQINKIADDREVAVDVLIDALATPRDLADAVRKIRVLADFLSSIRVGAHPSPKRAPFVASYWWGLDQPDLWPVAWFKSAEYVSYMTGISDYQDEGTRYEAFYRFAMDVDGDAHRFEHVAAWWADEKPVLIGDPLCDRAALREGARERGDAPSLYVANGRALAAAGAHIASSLESAVSTAAGRPLKAHKPSPMWDKDWPRGDLWADWRVPDTYGLSIRVWLNSSGLAIGLRPYTKGDLGSGKRAVEVLESQSIEGYEILAGGSSTVGRKVGFVGGSAGEVFYGRWFPRESLEGLDLKAEVVDAATRLAPLITELKGEQAAAPTNADDDLAARVAQFRAESGYPTAGHEQDRADQREFARLLDPEALATADRAALRPIWNTGRYGSPGIQSVLNTTVRDADDDEYQRILDTLVYLNWGEDPAEVRIDRVLRDDDYRVKGLGESVVMKMLAITHPERFLTVYPIDGPKGKRRMLKLLELTVPDSESAGTVQVQANDALRARLEGFFPNDTLAIGTFLYWLAEQSDPPVPVVADPLDTLAEELLVDRSFLDDLVLLLEDKKQVVFYGPPGTGKTYFARKLAEALVPEVERRPVVQFHPSTSYEDFFEGYRPEASDEGAMTYRLQAGPLAQLAARAADAPGRRHLMIIDEINRANLPKVLGELLFLFEYRDTPIRTLYRPDDPFELSKDIWFIGTMNTADRSIALVDAALRRRFHFIPFFPNHGPLAGLLDRWLERNDEPAWVGELVAQVNDELTQELGGTHLQLGASHFLKKGLDRDRLRRIWEYDIEPFIEDQFFGDPARIDFFRFDQVWKRFAYLAAEAVEPVTGDERDAED